MRMIDYETRYKKQLLQNIEEVRKHINDADMLQKIKNYCEKYDLPFGFVKNKIMIDNIYAIQFAKDPSRQSFHQQCAANFIREIPGVNNFCMLPAGGKDALFINDGCIVLKHDTPPGVETKSIDFSWDCEMPSGQASVYAAHKYTDCEGGSQDNQYKDLLLFMKHASLSKEPTIFFLAVGDGPYYQKRTSGQDTRIAQMNALYRTPHCMALTSNDIEAQIQQIMKGGVLS